MKKEPSQSERPPIVVVMGHVDHGKSTLLDYVRKTNIVAGEAGGITQHVAAYEVEREREGETKRITFIDTPGHAAFSAIRARGANVADIAILVVAADDGVKAQTLEALTQIREAGIPFIVAINKIDKPNADINRTQSSLMEQGVFLEKLGGDVSWVAISAKTGAGIEELLDLILIVAELQEYTADKSAPASGYIVEAHRDQKRGIAATLVITDGTLKMGMAVTAGRAIAPVRIIENHAGKRLKESSFSTPITLVGFDELPAVGEKFLSHKSKKEADAVRAAFVASQPKKLDTVRTEEMSEKFYMPVIIRADASGSLEAILQEVARLGDEFATLSIVQSGIGNISEGDIKAAIAGRVPAVVIGFNVGIDGIAEALSRQHAIRIEKFSIIYKLTERLTELLKETQPKREIETTIGRAKLLKKFSAHNDEHLVGGSVLDGYIAKKGAVRVMRRKELVGVGKILSLQANRQSVDRVEKGEFGAQVIADFEIEQGDVLEAFETNRV